MTESLITHMLYPKAIILMLASCLVLTWVSFFCRSLYSDRGSKSIGDYTFYIIYTIGLFFWILSNAYFHTGFLPLYSNEVATIMAIFANISAYIAFAAAYVFSCRLRASISRKPTPKWQYAVLACFTAFATVVNFVPGLTIIDVTVTAPSQFIIEFGPYTKGFFSVLISLVVLTFINLLYLRKASSRLGQTKINYMIAGIAIFMVSTAIIQLGFTYILNDFSLTWLPPALSISEMFFVGYALLTSRFYSSKYIAFIALSVIGTSAVFALPLSSVTLMFSSYNEMILAAALCILVGLSWAKVSYIVKRVIARVLYGSPYTPVEQILALERDFQHSTRNAIEKLAELLNIPQEKLQLVTNNYQDVAYANYLSSKKSILIVDEIANELSDSKSSIDERLSELHTKMHSSNTALVLPLYDHDSTVSHLLVSPHKKDGSLFSNEEISALQQVFSKVQSYINADRKVSQSQALANSIAHEMRNPLAQVQLQFEHLKLQVTSGDSLQSILGSIDKGSAAILRGRQLIDIILREVSDSSLQQEPASPNSISYALSTALGRYGFENEQVRQRVHFTDSDDFIANINDTLFSFVVFNLLRNAIYYFDSYPDSQIEITLQKGDHENCILFRDTGPGIEPTLRYKIFDDFFTHNKSGGSGLGLGYCQRVMEAFGGRIECISELDEFTEFQLYFPVVSIGSTISPPIPSTGSPDRYALHSSFSEPAPVDSTTAVDVTKKTILIVDDKEVQRALVKIYLEQLDINVIQANNGETAVSVFRSNDVDLVLMDIQMPKMNGFEASELIKEISPTTPIVALSGESSTYDLNRIDQLMDGRLEKPTTKQALESMITHLLAQKAQQQTVH
ncbi:hybrid sensor histidine kinase/response regulator [Vibrio paucivorans]|uniref:histidine kinase n=1 Tax=Vibrio paucivorans TaxID=2829489 RepID=A0A9X3CEQ5_9VIBR|nr:hybrid sensor histidine kinase/response regulator [Vibrio paucivorans]MCW8334351.1 hybrid sensor histidine kinase/response regulator [Vibrio paucivorans]